MSKRSDSLHRAGTLALLACACALSACSLTHLPTNIEPEAPLSASVEQAERKLAQARLDRDAAEARFAADEQLCYAKFFVNNCLDAAKEKRRTELAYQRAIELEAEYFVRKSKADQRDRELAAAEKEFAANEAAFIAQQVAPAAGVPPAAPAKGAKAPKVPGVQKPPKPPRAPKAPPTPAELQAEAAKRAANVVAYEKRQAEFAERQRRVAEKKAKRAAKEAAKAK